MESRNLFERLVDVSPGMEIWWDSSPVIFDNWCKKLLEKADAQDREKLSRQFGRMYDENNPESQLFRGVTTNPPLSLQAIQDDPPYWEKVAKGILLKIRAWTKKAFSGSFTSRSSKSARRCICRYLKPADIKKAFFPGRLIRAACLTKMP